MFEQNAAKVFGDKVFNKFVLEILLTVFVLLAFISGLWLAAVTVFLSYTNGTYSITYADGTKVCKIPFFAMENWYGLLMVLGLPIMVLIGSMILTKYVNSKILMGSFR